MWARHLLFWGLVIAGVSAFGATFLPRAKPDRPEGFRPWQLNSDEFRGIVSRVDGLFREQWAAEQLQPAGKAGDLTIARRISLAMNGTIPSLEEVRLLESRPAEHRTAWWLARLQEDRRSSDYLAERLARAFVGVNEGPFLLYRRRRFVSWLADQLQANRRYDEIVRELIASSGRWTDTPATNFITATITPDSDKDPDEVILAARVARAFLGVRIDCAECHDHPFEKWKQDDFHGLAAFFGATTRSVAGIRDGKDDYQVQDRNTLEMRTFAPRVPFQSELLPSEGSSRARLAAWVRHRENRAFARATVNRVWAQMFGRPLVEPIDDIPAEQGLPVLDALAEDLVAHRYDLRRLMQVIAATEVFQLDSQLNSGDPDAELTPRHEELWAVFPLTRLRPEQVGGSVLQASSLTTLDHEAHILLRLARDNGQKEFTRRYGDSGEAEFDEHGGTIPQRLLMMNGNLVEQRTHGRNLLNATPQIALLAHTDAKAIESAYLSILTRRPTADEARHFERRLEASRGPNRVRLIEDLCWTLMNSTEFAWNH
jgi:hypothetical protein